MEVRTIQITDQAVKWLKTLLESENKSPEEYGLRLAVRGGGCSGFTLVMLFDKPKEGDQVFPKDGVKVLVDPKSLQHIDGSILHYVQKLQGAGFTLINPNIKHSCGCGSSFATATK